MIKNNIKGVILTMMSSVLFILLSLFVSCSKAGKQPSYYRYKDPELPFTMMLEHPLGKRLIPTGNSKNFGGFLYHYDQRILNDYKQGIGYKEPLGAGLEITSYPLHDYNHANTSPTFCFQEAQPTKKGYQINLAQLVETSEGKFEKRVLPAWLDVLQSEYPEDAGEGDAPPQPYPGGAKREAHLITPILPEGSLPKNKKFFIEVRYFVITPSEPDYHKKAKEKANQQLCEAAKSFTWIVSKDLGTPPNWFKIRLEPEHPGPKISK